MEISPILLSDQVGPWEEVTHNPYLKPNNSSQTPEMLPRSHDFRANLKLDKLPSIPQSNKQRYSLINKKMHFNESNNNMGRSLLLTNREKINTIHMVVNERNGNPRDFKIENTVRKGKILQPLKDPYHKNKTQKKEEQDPPNKLKKNLDYFTPNLVSQYPRRTSLVEKTHIFKEISEDIHVKKLPLSFKSEHEQQISNSIINNDKVKKSIFESRNMMEEAIKIRLNHLKKIENNSTHFLKYFLLKYDEDLRKKAKFMLHPKNP